MELNPGGTQDSKEILSSRELHKRDSNFGRVERLADRSYGNLLNFQSESARTGPFRNNTVSTHADHVKRWPLIGSVPRCRDLSHSDSPSDLGLRFSSFYFELTRGQPWSNSTPYRLGVTGASPGPGGSKNETTILA